MASPVLLDTSAIYALVSASDDFHGRARRAYTRLLDRAVDLYTTSYILVEVYALIHRRLGFEHLKTLVESIRNVVNVYWIDAATHQAAWEAMVLRDGKDLSFVDWTTVLVARRLKAAVFGFDADLRTEDLTVIP